MTHMQKQIASDIAEVLESHKPCAVAIEYDNYGFLDETRFVGRTPDEAMSRAIEYFTDMRW